MPSADALVFKVGDAVLLNLYAFSDTNYNFRRFFPDDHDWRVVAGMPRSVGMVLSVRYREMIIPPEIQGYTQLSVTQTAEVAWPEGIVKQCPTRFLMKI